MLAKVCNNNFVTQAIPSPEHNHLSEVSIAKCDLCDHEFSYDNNFETVVNTASIKCPKCSFNQTTIRKPRISDMVAFAAPVAAVYVITIAALIASR